MNSTVRVLTYPSMKIANYFSLSKYNKAVILAPLVEEIQFRYLLQQVALKELPKSLMDRVLPDHQIDFDSKKAQLLRILVTAGIFAALHMTAIDCSNGGGGISQLIGGLFYSALIENGFPLMETIALHSVFNALPFILEYLGIPV